MGRASEVLIPTRFLLTMGYFIVLVLAFYQQDANVASGLGASPSSSALTAARSSLTSALALSIICVVFCGLSLLTGPTLFHDRLNATHALLHFFGAVLTAWFVVDMWGYTSMWWIWAFFALLPALFEATALFGIFVLKLHRLT